MKHSKMFPFYININVIPGFIQIFVQKSQIALEYYWYTLIKPKLLQSKNRCKARFVGKVIGIRLATGTSWGWKRQDKVTPARPRPCCSSTFLIWKTHRICLLLGLKLGLGLGFSVQFKVRIERVKELRASGALGLEKPCQHHPSKAPALLLLHLSALETYCIGLGLA